MDRLHLIPYGIGSLVGAIITLLTAAVLYHVYRRARRETREAPATRYLSLAFAFWGTNSAAMFLWYVLHTLWSPHLLLLQPILLSLALIYLMQFAYAFRGSHFHPREAPAAFYLAAGAVGLMALYIGGRVFTYGPAHDIPRHIFEMSYPLLLLWILIVFVRKWRKTGQTVFLYFAVLNAVLFVPAVTYQLVQQYILPLKLHVVLYDGVMCLYPPAFATLYIYFAAERLSVGLKLVGASLVTVLAVLGLAGLSFYEPGQLQERSGIIQPALQTIRFEPRGDSYVVTTRPSNYVEPSGANLNLQDRDSKRLALPFTFPFVGARWDSLYVSDNGVVTFGEQPCLAPTTQCFYTGRPAIAPLYADFVPDEGGGVFYTQHARQMRITWRNLPLKEQHRQRATLQLVLYRSGAFEFIYTHVDLLLQKALRGIHPGGRVSIMPVRFGGDRPHQFVRNAAVVEDFARQYRRFAAESVRWLYVAIGLFTVLIPPVFLLIARISVLSPVRELQHAAERINRHNFEVDLRERRSKDQIGDLRNAFVTMAGDLKQYATEMEQLVTSRTEEVQEQKRQLQIQAEHLETANEQLETKNQQLEEASAAKSQFLANISHELRSPLIWILSPINQALDGAGGPLKKTSRETLTMMKNQSFRLLGRINQLLALSRIEAGGAELQARPADLVPFLRTLYLEYSAVAERFDLTFHFETNVETCVVYIDPEKFETVIRNLLSNAFKFAPKGEQILLSLTAEKPGDISSSDKTVTVNVKNTGTRIPQDVLPFIFERFYQADATTTREHEGTGIGLALVQEFVELHQGTVTADSDALGTTFSVTLFHGRAHLQDQQIQSNDPAHGPFMSNGDETNVAWEIPRVPAAEDDVIEDPRTAPPEAPTILIVEDNDDVRTYIRMSLSGDYHLIEAADGKEGLNRAQDREPDVILLDVMLPKMDGFALCRTLKSDPALEHVPVIMLTALATREDREKGLEAGADDYLFKPFDAHELHVRLRNILKQRQRLARHFSQHITFWLGEDVLTVPSPQAAFLGDVTEVINEMLNDLHAPLTADELVERIREAGLRPDGAIAPAETPVARRTVARWLKDLTGMPPGQFLTVMRLLYARQLLEKQLRARAADPRREMNPEAVANKVDWTYSTFRKKFSFHFDVSILEFEAMYQAKTQLDRGTAAEEVARTMGYDNVETFTDVFQKVFPDWPA